jgi:hypothetical protein
VRGGAPAYAVIVVAPHELFPRYAHATGGNVQRARARWPLIVFAFRRRHMCASNNLRLSRQVRASARGDTGFA